MQMRAFHKILLPVCCATFVFYACKKDNAGTSPQDSKEEISKEEQVKIARAGFSPTFAVRVNGGYRVEGDIIISDQQLAQLTEDFKKAAKAGPRTEQYRSSNVVGGLPRVIRVAVDAGTSDSLFKRGTDLAIARYNALNLRLTFVRVDKTAPADITIKGEDLGTSGGATILGQSAGFPDASGNPATPIKLNNKYYNNQYSNLNSFVTTIAHEIGHAIGYRHSDYMNRGYSCGRTSWYDFLLAFGINLYDEGDGGVGAVHIANTPTDPDAKSWMLACSDGTDRPFTANDVIALKALYE